MSDSPSGPGPGPGPGPRADPGAGAAPAPVRLLLADDDPLVVRGLRLMLAGSPGLEVVGDVGDGDGLLAAVRATAPDVVLLDIRMPRVDGITALRELRAVPDQDPPAVIMLTTFDTEPVVLDAMRAGAAGFLLKHTPPADLVRAVLAAAHGEPTVSPQVLRRLMDHAAAPGTARSGEAAGQSVAGQPQAEPSQGRESPGAYPDPGPGAVRPDLSVLTAREREVADAVAEGHGNAEIARRLYLSQGSVKAHVSSALSKLGLDNRTQLAIAVHDATRAE